MSNGIFCDGPACTHWCKPTQSAESGFFTVFDGVYPSYAEFVAHFCSWDCMARYAEMKQPLDKSN